MSTEVKSQAGEIRLHASSKLVTLCKRGNTIQHASKVVSEERRETSTLRWVSLLAHAVHCGADIAELRHSTWTQGVAEGSQLANWWSALLRKMPNDDKQYVIDLLDFRAYTLSKSANRWTDSGELILTGGGVGMKAPYQAIQGAIRALGSYSGAPKRPTIILSDYGMKYIAEHKTEQLPAPAK